MQNLKAKVTHCNFLIFIKIFKFKYLTWFTWFPSAGSHEQTLPMVLPGTGTKLKTYLNPPIVRR